MKDILNIAAHSCDATTTLGWMLWRWQLDSQAPLLIITRKDDGDNLSNRLRVRLSEVRNLLKRANDKSYRHFGFMTQVIQWDSNDGRTYDALCLKRMIQPMHIMSEAIASVGGLPRIEPRSRVSGSVKA